MKRVNQGKQPVQFSWQTETPLVPRDKNIPGGNKLKKGGRVVMDGRNNFHEIDGGKKKVGRPKKGGKLVDDVESDVEDALLHDAPRLLVDAIGKPKGKKPAAKKGGGFWDDVGNVLETAAPYVAMAALGKPKEKKSTKKKGGENVEKETAQPPPQEVDEPVNLISEAGKKKGRPSKKGAGFFGSIGTAIDSVGDALGLGKTKKGGLQPTPVDKSESSSVSGVKMGGINMTSIPVTTTNPLETQGGQSNMKLSSKDKRKVKKEGLKQFVEEIEKGIKELKKKIRSLN